MAKSTLKRAVVTGTGSAVPDKILSNHDLEALVDTSDEWIVQRTGIRERRITTDDETPSTLSVRAAQRALCNAGLTPADIELIVVATVTGDYIWPSTSCLVQDGLGAVNAGAFDISAACAGFIYGLSSVSALIETGQVNNALLIGVDCLTKQVDWTDRSTCILFGDAAAACVLAPRENTVRGLLATVLLADGGGARHIILEQGGTKYPPEAARSQGKSNKIYMAGQEVYRFAINAMGDACERVIEKAGMSAEDIDLFVPHQANLRIIESAARRLGLPDTKVFVNVDRFGNTSGASIPLALDEASRTGRLTEGMVVLTVGFGAGLVWGANLLRW